MSQLNLSLFTVIVYSCELSYYLTAMKDEILNDTSENSYKLVCVCAIQTKIHLKLKKMGKCRSAV